jgi:hypothetical protein
MNHDPSHPPPLPSLAPPKKEGPPRLPLAIDGDIAESDLARVSGIAREDLKKMRGAVLREGVDWRGGAGLPILITPAGLESLRAQLAKDAAAAEALDGAATAVRTSAGYCTLVVVRVKAPRHLLCRRPEELGKSTCTVLVKSTANWMPKMEVPKCQRSRWPGLYYYHGHQPRRKGRL